MTAGPRLVTRPARTHDDVRAFFDASAADYAEQHGDAAALLARRLRIIRRHARFTPSDRVLEIGCGNGLHLVALADDFSHGIGVDLSPAMIAAATARLAARSWRDRLTFAVDQAEHLRTIADRSVDVVFVVGAFEHMLDQPAVLTSARRVLRPGGRFVCLTLNGGSLWYGWLAPRLAIDTRQLATDQLRRAAELRALAAAAGFQRIRTGHWTFVQRGDQPRAIAALLDGLDLVGRATGVGALRGGLVLRAERGADYTSRRGATPGGRPP